MKYILICIMSIGFSFSADADWNFVPYPSDKPVENIITSIAVDHDGVIWIGCDNGIVWSRKNDQWYTYSRNITGLSSWSVFDILVDNDNNKWFASGYSYTADPLVVSFDGDVWKQFPFIIISSVPGEPVFQRPINPVRQIALDKNNVLWFAGQGGVIQLNPDMSLKAYYGKGSIFFNSIVTSVSVDLNNIKWFGISYTDSTSNSGDLASYDGITWKLHNQSDVPVAGKSINEVECGVDNSLCISLYFEEGTYLYKNSLWTKIDSLHGPNLSSPAADKKGGFWLLVYDFLHKPVLFNGVLRLTDTDTEMFFNKSLFNDFFLYKIYVDTNNTKWFVSRNGIWRYDESGTGVSQKENRYDILSLANHPNPFNSSTILSFTLPASGAAALELYSLAGQRVRTLVSGSLSASSHSVIWDGRDDFGKPVSSGVYLSRLQMGDNVAFGRMILLK
ncbi:MAG: two-component regulator propeller domain-containing protein [Candidatus Latescibacter sp.]|nr:two-component regulator propeller domain-containing protein [Candidatus Latescibacter sp.]